MEFFFLSQVLGRSVRTEQGERVARIKDLVARVEALNATGEVAMEMYPPVSGLVVDIEKRPIFIPWDQVASLSAQGARLGSARIDLQHFVRREGEVLLAADILDRQLIDIDGRRVIRANDLQLYSLDGSVRLAAVDISGEALARRLAFGRLFTGNEKHVQTEGHVPQRKRRTAGPAPRLIKWAGIELLAVDSPDLLLRLSHDRLAQLNPVDIAHIADDLNYSQGAEIIQSLDDEIAADTLQEMDEERQADIMEGLDRERAADILEEMDPDDAADLLADLDEVQAADLLRRMAREDAEDVEDLLAYEEDSAGGIMTSDFLALPPSITAQQAIDFMRKLEEAPDLIDFVFVVADEERRNWEDRVDEGGVLLGIVPLRDLVLAPPDTVLRDLMIPDFIWVGPDESHEEAAHLMAEYNLMALPVLDEEQRLLGVITVDDAMDVVIPERNAKRRAHAFS